MDRLDKINAVSTMTIETAIRLGVLFLLFAWCFQIISPFIIPVIWAVIIAVAIYPLFIKLVGVCGGRSTLAATIFTLLTLASLITPTVMISSSIIDTSQGFSQELQQGELTVRPPNASVKDWPLVGDKIYGVWTQASKNLEATLHEYSEYVKKIGSWFLSALAGAGSGVLQFVISIIIAGVFLANASGAGKITEKIFVRLSNSEQGVEYQSLSVATIRSVAQGVLGIAIIQSVMAGIGLYLMGVPAWGVWTVLILVLAIAQLPPILVLGPIIAYVFSVADTTPAIIFTIWSVVVSASDGFLKPMFLGRGMDTPMLVILLGAIGGMMLSGIIGLFVGAIALALGYELFMVWLNQNIAGEHDKA